MNGTTAAPWMKLTALPRADQHPEPAALKTSPPRRLRPAICPRKPNRPTTEPPAAYTGRAHAPWEITRPPVPLPSSPPTRWPALLLLPVTECHAGGLSSAARAARHRARRRRTLPAPDPRRWSMPDIAVAGRHCRASGASSPPKLPQGWSALRGSASWTAPSFVAADCLFSGGVRGHQGTVVRGLETLGGKVVEGGAQTLGCTNRELGQDARRPKRLPGASRWLRPAVRAGCLAGCPRSAHGLPGARTRRRRADFERRGLAHKCQTRRLRHHMKMNTATAAVRAKRTEAPNHCMLLICEIGR